MAKGKQKTQKFLGMDAPCLDCPNRHLGCHDECPEYKAFQRRIRARNAMRKYYYVER